MALLFRVVGDMYGVHRTWKQFDNLESAKLWIEKQKAVCTPCAKASFKNIVIEEFDPLTNSIAIIHYI
jgi:hypothetical protein